MCAKVLWHRELIAAAAVLVITALVFAGCQYNVNHDGLKNQVGYDSLTGEWLAARGTEGSTDGGITE